jgi:hypothetical protein
MLEVLHSSEQTQASTKQAKKARLDSLWLTNLYSGSDSNFRFDTYIIFMINYFFNSSSSSLSEMLVMS